MQLNLYASGALVPSDGEYPKRIETPRTKDITLVKSDIAIQTLFKRLTQDQRGQLNIDDKMEVVNQALRFFDNYSNFMALQYINNNFMNGANLDFLQDTTNYILTGQRRFQMHTWLSLIQEYPDYVASSANNQRFWDMQDKLPRLDDESKSKLPHGRKYISMWCSHENGVIDMLYTLWILFGKAYSEPNY